MRSKPLKCLNFAGFSKIVFIFAIPIRNYNYQKLTDCIRKNVMPDARQRRGPGRGHKLELKSCSERLTSKGMESILRTY